MTATISATDVEVKKPVNVYYERILLDNVAPVCPYFAGTKKGMLEKKQGTATIKFRRFNPINPDANGGKAAPSALSELTTTASYGQGRTARAISMTDYTATILKYGDHVILNEEVDLYVPNAMGDEVITELSRLGAKGMNRLQRDVAEDELTKVYAGGVASDGAIVSKITPTEIRKVVNVLSKNDAATFTPLTTGDVKTGTSPILEAYWGITHPDVAQDIEQMAGFKSVETYAGQVDTVPGEFGAVSFAGTAVRFIQTSEASVDAGAGGTSTGTGLADTSTDVDVYNTVIYGRNCLGSVGLGKEHTDGIYRADGSAMDALEIRNCPLGSGGTSDPYGEIQTISVKYFHAGLVLDANRGRVIRSGATDLT